MERARARELLLAGLRSVQATSGRAWTDLADRTKVIGGLAGFDSIAGIETTCIVEGILAAEVPSARITVETLFVDGRRALTLSEAVDLLMKSIEGA